MKSTDSIENYIKAIYSLSSRGKEWINTNQLAEKMEIQPSSVTDMLKKLNERKLVDYQRYKGVKLTMTGNTQALEVIRKHRLWEVFLQKELGFNWDEVHDIAEQLEHISSDVLVERLDKYLGFPKYDPHGDPIPDANGKIKASNRSLLSSLKENEGGKIVGVYDSSTSFLKFLEKKKLFLGSAVKVVKRHDYDQSIDIQIDGNKSDLTISKEVSQNLYILKK